MDKAMLAWARKAGKGDGKWPKPEIKAAKKLAEKLKGKGAIDNPHALSRWMVARGMGKK
jgi:hypothetical protein